MIPQLNKTKPRNIKKRELLTLQNKFISVKKELFKRLNILKQITVKNELVILVIIVRNFVENSLFFLPNTAQKIEQTHLVSQRPYYAID